MKFAMIRGLVILCSAAVAASAATLNVRGGNSQGQDPCAGCDESLAQAYQTCAREYGNPCAERNEAGLVSSGPGTKKDVSCCLKKEKHDRCLSCKTMDCSFKTCNVNKKYYSERAMEEKFDDAKAMKDAGWG